MTSMEQSRGGNPTRHLSGQVGRALARIDGKTCIQVARLEGCADVEVARVDAVATVAQRALQGVAFISQIESQLSQAVPEAAGRLQAVGGLATLALGQVVTDSVVQLRRCR